MHYNIDCDELFTNSERVDRQFTKDALKHLAPLSNKIYTHTFLSNISRKYIHIHTTIHIRVCHRVSLSNLSSKYKEFVIIIID